MTSSWPDATTKLVRNVKARTPGEIRSRVHDLIREHDRWRDECCLNLSPAETSLLPHVRAALACNMAGRLSEGFPGCKLYPRGPQNRMIDEIEAMIIALAKRLFSVEYVDWRPNSTSLANAAVYFSVLKRGDSAVVQGEDGGGNYSYQAYGTLGLAGASVICAPHANDDAFGFDLRKLRKIARRTRPALIVCGGSNVNAIYPVPEIREIADECGSIVLFDAAHLALQIAHGHYPHPIQEGAHVMTVSTHKTLAGPVGGMILTNSADLADRLWATVFPGLQQTRDQNKLAALALSLTDVLERGHHVSLQMIESARALALALSARGLTIVGPSPFGTHTHQLFVRIGSAADVFERRCQEANILLSSCMLEDDYSRSSRSGLRIATHELAWRGLGPQHMEKIARLIVDAGSGAVDVNASAASVKAFLADYPAS